MVTEPRCACQPPGGRSPGRSDLQAQGLDRDLARRSGYSVSCRTRRGWQEASHQVQPAVANRPGKAGVPELVGSSGTQARHSDYAHWDHDTSDESTTISMCPASKVGARSVGRRARNLSLAIRKSPRMIWADGPELRGGERRCLRSLRPQEGALQRFRIGYEQAAGSITAHIGCALVAKCCLAIGRMVGTDHAAAICAQQADRRIGCGQRGPRQGLRAFVRHRASHDDGCGVLQKVGRREQAGHAGEPASGAGESAPYRFGVGAPVGLPRQVEEARQHSRHHAVAGWCCSVADAAGAGGGDVGCVVGAGEEAAIRVGEPVERRLSVAFGLIKALRVAGHREQCQGSLGHGGLVVQQPGRGNPAVPQSMRDAAAGSGHGMPHEVEGLARPFDPFGVPEH